MTVDLRQGDCLEGLRSLPAEFIDLVVTSPPFNLGGDFHSSYQDGTRLTHGDYGEYADDMPEPEYQDWQVAVLGELYRVLKPGGSLYYQHKVRIKDGVAIHPLSWILRTPFLLKQEITLRFPGTVNKDGRRFWPVAERIYWLTKEPKTSLVDPRCGAYTDVWEINHVRSRKEAGHPASFEPDLPRRCILASSKPDDLVCDPFFGRGTTAIEAASLGRRFIGWELDPKYVKLARHNVSRVQGSFIGTL